MSLTAEEQRAFDNLPADEKATFVKLASARNEVRDAKKDVSRAETQLELAKARLEKATKAFAAVSDEALNKSKLAMTP